MNPVEQVFNIIENTREENIIKWLSAFARIPTKNLSAATFASTIRTIATYFGAEEKVDRTDYQFANGFYVDQMWFEDLGALGQEKSCFAIIYYPFGGDWDLIFHFNIDNVSGIYDSNNKFAAYLAANGVWNHQQLTWQESYDLICKLVRYDRKSVPEPPVEGAS